MKKKTYTFKVGDRVGEFTSEYQEDDYGDSETVPLMFNPDAPPEFGVVTSVTSDGKITIKWDYEYRNQHSLYMAPKDPADFAPEDVVRARLSVLEEEFYDVEKQVKAKMKEVAKGIREANKLAKKTGRPLSQMYDVFRDTLYRAMDAAGWRTSSFGC